MQILHRLSLLFGESRISAEQFQQVVEVYGGIPLRDKILIHARLLCLQPIMMTLDKYLPQSGVIIDLGCGYGLVSNLLALESEHHLIGVELSAQRAAVAKRSVGDRHNIEFLTEDAAKYEFPCCDSVLLLDVLYLQPDEVKTEILARAYDSLEKNGLLIVKDNAKSPRWKYFYAYVEEFIKLNLAVIGYHKRVLTPKYKSREQSEALLQSLGFTLIETINIKTIMPYPGVIYVCRKGKIGGTKWK